MLIDAHAHLDRYDKETLPAALAEIGQAEIFTISTAMDLPSYERSLDIAMGCDLVLPAFGIHPWNAPAYADRLDDIRQAVARSPVLGEIGLDYHFVEDPSHYPAQRKVFDFFLAAAKEQGKIVNLHTSGTEREILALLSRHDIRRAIVHWYAGPFDTMHAMAQRGVFFTIGVEVLSSPRIQSIARAIPPEQLLTETDNPDGLQWLTGVLGMPVRVREVAQKLAELRNTTSDAIIRSVQENLARLMRDDPWLSDPYARFFR
ncbi:MAG TPA: TatD family hydrolase [Candidatus Methylomirabilis sp.]|nr:TatD family hydrolase [Candidatus Methylomirabilis sp.]